VKKLDPVKGTGFSPYINQAISERALAPEVKGTGFSPYLNQAISERALAPEVKGAGFTART
jgi:hypothetical protein